MNDLRDLAAPRDFPMAGDSKLISYTNVTAMAEAHVTFVAPLAASRVPDGLFAGLDPAEARLVDHTPERAMDRRLGSPAPDTLTRTAGTRHQPTVEAVTAKASAIARKRRVTAHLTTTITTGDDGKPVFAWSFDQATLTAEAAADGWYALLTNLPDTVDAEGVFLRYKGQPMVERRYGEFKSPLAVAPIPLRDNRRITARLTVICLALLIFCLIEREVRRNLAPDYDMTGFYVNDGRARRPTGRLILQALDKLRLIPGNRGEPATIPTPGAIQNDLLKLLKVDPTRPRWP